MDTPLILYTHPLSANGRKVLVMAELLNLPLEIKLVNVYQGEGQTKDFFAINPLGQIPTLETPHHGKVLLESNAIMLYLCEHAGNHSFYPLNLSERSAIHQWLFWESSQWQPAISQVLRAMVGHRLLPHLIPAPLHDPQWDEPLFARQLAYLESFLSKRHSPFLVGNCLSVADVSVAGMMIYFPFAKFPFDAYPHIHRWFKQIQKLPAWHKFAVTIWEEENNS